MTYESVERVESRLAEGVTYFVSKMSFARRMELMKRVRELAGRSEFLVAGQDVGERMDAALLEVEIERMYVMWGLREVTGLEVDGSLATPQSLSESGPENLFREALAAVRTAAGLSDAERKN
jgi:hypothetical protein